MRLFSFPAVLASIAASPEHRRTQPSLAVVSALVAARGFDNFPVDQLVDYLSNPLFSTSDLPIAAGHTAHAAFERLSVQPKHSVPRHRSVRPPLLRAYHVEATAFLHEIVRAADGLREARAFNGSPALQYGARWQLLRAIERCGGAPTFADLGRSLRISRQAARESALRAEKVGAVELFPAPDDRRLLQVALTPGGRRELEAQRLPDFGWLFTLLKGLEPVAMRSTYHVLSVIRQRLERYEREMRSAQRGMGSPFRKATSPRTWR